MDKNILNKTSNSFKASNSGASLDTEVFWKTNCVSPRKLHSGSSFKMRKVSSSLSCRRENA